MTREELDVELSTAGPVPVVRVAGPMFLRDVAPLQATLVAALETAPRRQVVCDVAGLAVPASTYLLTAFPAALRRVGGWPYAALHLAGPSAALDRALHRLRIHRFVPVHADVADAGAAIAEDAGVEPVQLRLPPDPGMLAAARAALHDLWPAHASSRGRDDAVLVMNELASNAIRHVAAPFTVAVGPRSDHVLVAVTDESRREPTLQPAPAPASSGRGLHVVAALSRDWGVRLVYQHGKTVWARVPAPPHGAARIPTPRSRRGS